MWPFNPVNKILRPNSWIIDWPNCRSAVGWERPYLIWIITIWLHLYTLYVLSAGASYFNPTPGQGTILIDLNLDDPEYISVVEQMRSTMRDHKDNAGGVFDDYNIIKVRHGLAKEGCATPRLLPIWVHRDFAAIIMTCWCSFYVIIVISQILLGFYN